MARWYGRLEPCGLAEAQPDWPEAAVARSFAVVREAAKRQLGQRHYDVQLIGAFAMIRGMVAEMATGEGKTLDRNSCRRDGGARRRAGPCGHGQRLSCGTRRRNDESALSRFSASARRGGHGRCIPVERAAAYRCDITYCTNKDLAFDYMRDRLRAGRRLGNLRRKVAGLASSARPTDSAMLRGLHFAIIDEADSVLIDEARTPLILSGEVNSTRDDGVLDVAIAQANRLRADVDFRLIRNERRLELLGAGRQRIEELARLGSPWDVPAERERADHHRTDGAPCLARRRAISGARREG